MHEAVSDILLERSREADGVSRMVLISFLAHAMLIAALVLIPAGWRSSSRTADVTPMMITLSSGSGPDTGGLTPISGKPVQQVAAETKPAPVAPPASKTPEMTLPDPKAPAKTPPKRVERPVDKSTTRKANAGPEVKTGDARADTGGAPIPFGGLTRPSGGGSANSSVFTDYSNFCCPSYLNQMVDLIKELEPEPGGGGTGSGEVHDPSRRHGV